MEITNASLDAFIKDFRSSVADLERKYEVTISLGRITYEEERFTTKMTVINGLDPEEVARAAFDADVWKYEHLGLTQGMYNRLFIAVNGKRYAIHGFNTRAPKYPLKVIDVTTGEHRRAGEGFIRRIEDGTYIKAEYTVEPWRE